MAVSCNFAYQLLSIYEALKTCFLILPATIESHILTGQLRFPGNDTAVTAGDYSSNSVTANGNVFEYSLSMVFNIVSPTRLVAKKVVEMLVYIMFNIKLLQMILRPPFR